MDNNMEVKTPAITDTANNSLTDLCRIPLYRIPIFLGYSKPYMIIQQLLLDKIIELLQENLLFPRTLMRSVSDLSTETNLVSFRRMILSSYGMLSISFHKIFIKEAILNPNAQNSKTISNFWLNSPFLQIEPAMAFQQGLPQLLLLETEEDENSTDSSSNLFGGIYERNSTPYNILKFSLVNNSSITNFFNSSVWKDNFSYWVGQVKNAYKMNTEPRYKFYC